MIVYLDNPKKRKIVYDILNIFYNKEEIIFDRKSADILIEDDFLILGDKKIKCSDNLYLKKNLYKYLVEKTGYEPLWGILTGSKPSKLLKNYSLDEIKEKYLLNDDKIKILDQVKKIQQKEKFNPNSFNLYINIPFCPTRCEYCSYPTIVGNNIYKSLYIDFILRELDEVKLPHNLDTVYIGGGTPSFLSHKDLERLLKNIKQKYNFCEFTFEAGREDSLDFEKLEIFKEYKVNRISINPQTFTRSVIKNTGRIQDIDKLINLFYKARDLGFIINMDFIIGLFGEDRESFKNNFKILEELRPHNITFHALAQKVGSKYYEKNILGSKKDAILISEDIKKFSQKFLYEPYYLYRQKNIISNLENIGYQRDNTHSRYNILINEELENIIGLGMNANSKLMNGKKYRNAKNLRDYFKYIDDEIREKNNFIENILKI